MQFRGGEHEIDMFGWFFQGLQQCVEGLGGEHMDFVYDDNLVSGRSRKKTDFFLELTDFLDAAVGGAVDFMQVECCSPHDIKAGTAMITGNTAGPVLAVDGLGHDPGEGGFAHSAKS